MKMGVLNGEERHYHLKKEWLQQRTSYVQGKKDCGERSLMDYAKVDARLC